MKNKIDLETLRHSTSHLMAAAILNLWPKVKFGIGPAIANGFYYDFEFPKPIEEKDLNKIEEEMRRLIKKNLKFIRQELTINEAKELFKKLDQPYKLELLSDLEKHDATIKNQKSNNVTIYQLGDFIDLCRGPHIPSLKDIGSFKLIKIAGAYWKGSEKNKMLTRIYGLAFETPEELKKYLKQEEEAKKRDHRLLGESLELFKEIDEIGPGLILWLPKGAILKKTIEDYVLKEYLKNGYKLVSSPHLAKIDLWKISGHIDFYKESMFPSIHLKEIKEEKDDYQIKPMNCPFHIAIFKDSLKSYRDLPLRYTEMGTVYRYEKSGVLHGLTRVRGFTQDDAHIFCAPSQLDEEIEKSFKLALKILRTFGFKKYEIFLSTQPDKFVGEQKIWDKAMDALKKTLSKSKIPYQIDPGGGVFYGPKIDIKIKDSLGRPWQCSTIQVDFNLPSRFNLFFIDEKGKKEKPIMIHRALLGSLERFIGVLLENYAGALPFWLSPVQINISSVGKKHKRFALKLAKEFEDLNIRVEVNNSNETIPYKVRKAEKQKIPYILVIGDKEMKGKYLNVRERGKKNYQKTTKKQFIEKLLKEAIPQR
ncbi:MAG: Threonine--tRNA ligase 2 [Parcubacteria group bacterium ADurb.Bin159]|nr:MAG: Threonine--tRNA ligase 2 [Parcubacteria group bacterium ADurb.Bin159]